MEASFFYKLTPDAPDFDTIQFQKPEISISTLKELIIKDKFEDSISLKELDIVDYTSRKKYSDTDVIKKNSYLIVSKIPKLILSSKSLSFQSKVPNHQVATIQPFKTSDIENNEEKSSNKDTCINSYEHFTTNTSSTTIYTSQATECKPSQSTNSQSQLPHPPMLYSTPQATTYIYPTPDPYGQPVLYQPHLYAPLTMYSPYYTQPFINPHYSTYNAPMESLNQTRPLDKTSSYHREKYSHHRASHHERRKSRERDSKRSRSRDRRYRRDRSYSRERYHRRYSNEKYERSSRHRRYYKERSRSRRRDRSDSRHRSKRYGKERERSGRFERHNDKIFDKHDSLMKSVVMKNKTSSDNEHNSGDDSAKDSHSPASKFEEASQNTSEAFDGEEVKHIEDSKFTENNGSCIEDSKHEEEIKERDITNSFAHDKIDSPVKKVKTVSNQLSPSSYS